MILISTKVLFRAELCQKNKMMSDNYYMGELLLRVFTGLLFLYQGYDKLFRIKMPGVIDAFSADAQRYHVPGGLLKLVAYYTSVAEFAGGMLLVLGLFTPFALYALGIDLLLVSLAFSYMNPMWDMKHVFPRLILVAALLLLPEQFRLVAIDHFLN